MEAAVLSLYARYCAGAAAPFYPAHGGDAAALARQNARTPSAARDASLAALRAGAAAVVTGQQVGLFLGPLFTLYKAASAVRLAQALAEESGAPVVPVFWLQTEDHDLPEIAACHVPHGDGAPLTVALPAPAGERIALAHCTLPPEVESCLATLAGALAHLPHAAAHLERLRRCYRPGPPWGAAFADLLDELFAPYGLVLIDARDPALAAAAAPLHRRALCEAGVLAAALERRGAALRAAGFTPRVHVRPGAPLAFFHPEGPAGPRHRLAPVGDGYALVGGDGTWTTAALCAALERDPLALSSSALLRPLVQDTLLPTAAYVGGPAEVEYFAQVAALYEALGMPMPLVVPRASLRIIDAPTARRLARLGLTPDEAGRADAEVRATGGATPRAAVVPERLLAPFAAALAALRGDIEPLGPGIAHAVEKTRASVTAAVQRLAEKVAHAERHADVAREAALQHVRHMLWPGGQPQERVFGLPYFAARFGDAAFVARVLAAALPGDGAVRDLVWEEAAG